MLIDEFKRVVLIEPLQNGLKELHVLSGYASAAMARQHLTGGSVAGNLEPHFPSDGHLEVIVGMYCKDGITTSDHQEFLKLRADDEFRSRFSVLYKTMGLPCHSKVYVWATNGKPKLAFLGSANYSLSAARNITEEVLTPVDPAVAMDYVRRMRDDCEQCELISNVLHTPSVPVHQTPHAMSSLSHALALAPNVTLPLTERGNNVNVPERSGLNWGQRPEENRNPDQAYLSVPAPVREFFPPRGEFFTVLTDDGRTFMMSRNQDGGKALHTPDNAEIGRYFRDRLGVAHGAFVHIHDLKAYGRLDVTFFHLGQDTFYMDFSRRTAAE